MGLRAKATAMLVPTSSVEVCSAASSSGKNGSLLISPVQQPSYPAARGPRHLRDTSEIAGYSAVDLELPDHVEDATVHPVGSTHV